VPVKSYGQFCPVAKASEIFAERWTPLILRELLCGSHRFSELELGLPGIPRSLLVQRLRTLEDVGIVERRPTGARKSEYHLTPAGQELFDIVQGLGEWGQRWANREIKPGDLSPSLLMWDMHRRVHVDRLPDQRVVARFDFFGKAKGMFWLVLERPEPSVCLTDPGFEVDLYVEADATALHEVWMGQRRWPEVIKSDLVRIEGPSTLARAMPRWFALSTFADVKPVTPAHAARLA
jgi:DNA-binding HxlR family transcriptional regulator